MSAATIIVVATAESESEHENNENGGAAPLLLLLMVLFCVVVFWFSCSDFVGLAKRWIAEVSLCAQIARFYIAHCACVVAVFHWIDHLKNIFYLYLDSASIYVKSKFRHTKQRKSFHRPSGF